MTIEQQQDEVSDKPSAITRMNGARVESEILRQLASVTQVVAAKRMDVHPSTVSRMVEKIAEVAQLMAAIGLRVAPIDAVVVDEEEQFVLMRMANKWTEAELERYKMRRGTQT
jgi:plasmid maintenance system antidote protein VapI